MSATALDAPALGTTTAEAALDAAPPHVLGRADAPAALLAFGTYECLHCRRAWPALRALADEGAVRVEWRHVAPPGAFPLAGREAAAAEAAAAQGAFWAVHEALMEAPAPLAATTIDRVLDAAGRTLGLDGARLRADTRSPAVLARVDAQQAAAAALGVRGTPALFLRVGDGEPEPLDARADLDELRELVRRRTLV